MAERRMCERCQGNGEIVASWDRYLHPLPGDVGDEAVAECPDCNGEGEFVLIEHDEERLDPDRLREDRDERARLAAEFKDAPND